MSNPLLHLRDPLPFDAIRGEHVEPAVASLLAEAGARLSQLEAEGEGDPTYASTLDALEAVGERLELAMTVVGHLESVATTKELRAAFNAVQPQVSAFSSRLALSAGLWKRLERFAETAEAKALTGPKKRFLEKTIADFRRNGADLDEAGKDRLAAIDMELATTTLKFSQNVLDATNAFELVIEDRAKLAGLPEQAIEAARDSAKKKGREGYRFTLQAPSYTPVLTYLDDAEIREKLYRAFNTRASAGPFDNRPLLARILELRAEKAKLLGFQSFADLVLEDRMAKTGKAARDFVETLRARTEPWFHKENDELLAFRREIEGPDAKAPAPWDVSYYAEKMRRARFDFDEEALRPYFSLDNVMKGLFEIAGRLYGVKFEPLLGAPVWHPSIRAYLMREPSGEASSVFYVDVYPRETKRDGAWMHGLWSALPGTGSRHIEILAGNMTEGVDGKPALLSHREVETMFHEFGHLMHHAASQVPVRALSGCNVAWDFVELPSQIMENFCWEREALDVFARHHETGETIPEELLNRLRKARTFRTANQMMRQLGFAETDLGLHVDYQPARDGDVVTWARSVLQRFSSAELPEGHAMIAGFSHLFSSPVGYAAGYYSYKWAEVLDADAFSRFLSEGLFNPEVGKAFREGLLSRGDSEDPAILYRTFMGREPKLDALFERDGLVASGAPA